MYTHSLARISILPYGEGCVARFFLAVALATAFFFIGSEYAFAQSSKFELSQERIIIREDEYGEYEDYVTEVIHTIEDGGEYAVILNEEYDVYIYSEATPNTDGGYLYRINDEGQREFVETLGGYEGASQWSWETPGTYELDVYEMEPLILTERTPLQRVLDWIVGYTVHAQSPDRFVETMHFTITDQNAPAECCSSVVFLPGIKGSILKQGENTLWPPSIWSQDVSKLALDEDGESASGIIVDGVLGTFYSEPVYEPFIDFMEELVEDEIITEWSALPYDWRFSPEHILEHGVETPNGNTDLIEEIKEVAQRSPTKKVHIVTHSMGGIMGKAIVESLVQEGGVEIVESFVLVGSPQLGTPQTVAALLHGDGENIERVIGLISFANKEDSREVGLGIQSSHNLLPSRKYFEEVLEPVISFKETSSLTDVWRDRWGTTIDSYDEYREFLEGEEVSRIDPESYQILTPEILNPLLLERADDLHAIQDEYEYPESIRVVEIAGWGNITLKGIEYQNGRYGQLEYRPQFTSEGDSTVIYKSAVASDNSEKFYFDSAKYMDDSEVLVEHKDLLSAEPIQDSLLMIIMGEEVEFSEVFTKTKPQLSEEEKALVVSTHSPVILGAYDEEGNYTGVVFNEEYADGYQAVKKDIPGSSFHSYGDSQYLFVPAEGKYTFVYEGIGNGSTTVEVGMFEDDEIELVSSYTDVPTQTGMLAELSLDSQEPDLAVHRIDQDSDGEFEVSIVPDGVEPVEEALSQEELIQMLKQKIEKSDLKRQQGWKLLSKVKVYERLIDSKIKHIKRPLQLVTLIVIEKEIKHLYKKRLITEEELEIFIDIVNKLKQTI